MVVVVVVVVVVAAAAAVVVVVEVEAVAEVVGAAAAVAGDGGKLGLSPRLDPCPSGYRRRSCPPRCSCAPGESIGLQQVDTPLQNNSFTSRLDHTVGLGQ